MLEEIKKSYRKLLMAYHPDRLLDTELSVAERERDFQLFYEVQRAWEALEQTFFVPDAVSQDSDKEAA